MCGANVDLTTQDSIVMATDLDPDGERTLGVLTKVDIMNKGSDCSKILRGEEIPLRYGYVAVKGRSMQDMKNGMTMAESLQAEREWFDEHPIYSNLPNADECLGTDSLVNKLSVILSRHIKKNLPLIIEEIEQKLNACDARLTELGIPLPVGDSAKMQVVWRLLNDYTTGFKSTIQGKYSKVKRDDEPTGA